MFSFGMFRLDGSFCRVGFVGAVDRGSRGWRSPSGQNRQGLRLANQRPPRPPNIHLPRGAHRNPKSFEKNNLTRDLPERFLTSRVKQGLTYGLPWRKAQLIDWRVPLFSRTIQNICPIPTVQTFRSYQKYEKWCLTSHG